VRAAAACAAAIVALLGCGNDPWKPSQSDVERACTEVLHSMRVISDSCSEPLPPEYPLIEVFCPLLDPYQAGTLYQCAIEIRDLTCEQAAEQDLSAAPACAELIEGESDETSSALLLLVLRQGVRA